MPRYTSGQNTRDPITNIPIIGGNVRITQDGNVRVTQTTGEPFGGLNTAPGSLTPAPPGQSITLPYGFVSIPLTGPLR